MVDGIVLTKFDDIKGFVPITYFPSNIKPDLLKNIIYRGTVFAMGAVDDMNLDRESLMDLREDGIIGLTYMCALNAMDVRGGQTPIVLINFTAMSNRYNLYHCMTDILKKNKNMMINIKKIWNGKDFTDLIGVREYLKEVYEFSINIINKSKNEIDLQIPDEFRFTIKCPECSNEAILLVPKNIEKLISIPVINLPCSHEFEVYFTAGPTFRGTSAVKSEGPKEDDLRDIFDLI